MSLGAMSFVKSRGKKISRGNSFSLASMAEVKSAMDATSLGSAANAADADDIPPEEVESETVRSLCDARELSCAVEDGVASSEACRVVGEIVGPGNPELISMMHSECRQ
ncbi:hypothetical protein [Pandoraea anhela]|uniref:hypothetical protein n=1 Tax=Pandoraea anhela TaxID=2508295 RepID=UPI001582DE8F|nr:hypothetical protein [Pandoraea anhela]